MIVVKESNIFAFNIPVEQLHHLDHLFRWILGSDHHVDAFQVGLAFEVAAVAVHCRHHNEWGHCRCDRDDGAGNASRGVGAYRGDNVHGQEFLAVTAVLKITMPAQHVRKLVGQHGRQLRFVVHQSQQTSADVNRTIRQGESVWLRIAQGAKVP